MNKICNEIKVKFSSIWPSQVILIKYLQPLLDFTRLIWNFFLKEILDNFHPAFRFFFYEEYPNPEKWFNQRRSYTHSVATSSIAGYILGLGDRHVRNMLLDINTAEIIHIDFGYAHENATLLPTPERVPFRMTQVCSNSVLSF